MYENGLGVLQRNLNAYMWYNTASFNGNKEALLLLLSCDWSYDLPGKDGRTVLDILKDEGYDDLYKYVKNKYANKLNDYE